MRAADGEGLRMQERIRYQMGKTLISRIDELQLMSFSPSKLFPALAAEVEDERIFPRDLLSEDGNIILSCHSWLLQDGTRTILVDTGAGAGKSRPFAPYFDNLSPPFLENLADHGVKPEDVDLVLLTHLHVDHVGWNTRRDGDEFVPTFPNAKYVFCADEYAFFSNPENLIDRHRTSFMAREDSVDPVVRFGQALMIEANGAEVLSGIRFIPTPGHSPFHTSIALATDDGEALFAGDTLHHQSQVVYPDVNSVFDADPERARASRKLVLERAARPGTIMFGAHLAGTSAIQVSKGELGYRWLAAPRHGSTDP